MAYTAIRRLSDLPFKVIGPQPAFDPDDLEKFVREARIAVLSYARKDGRPCQVPRVRAAAQSTPDPDELALRALLAGSVSSSRWPESGGML